MPSEETNVATRHEWRALGFFYDCDDVQKQWRIVGSRAGLERFYEELIAFAGNRKNEPTSEHVHLGPYMYPQAGFVAGTTDHKSLDSGAAFNAAGVGACGPVKGGFGRCRRGVLVA